MLMFPRIKVIWKKRIRYCYINRGKQIQKLNLNVTSMRVWVTVDICCRRHLYNQGDGIIYLKRKKEYTTKGTRSRKERRWVWWSIPDKKIFISVLSFLYFEASLKIKIEICYISFLFKFLWEASLTIQRFSMSISTGSWSIPQNIVKFQKTENCIWCELSPYISLFLICSERDSYLIAIRKYNSKIYNIDLFSKI